MPINPEIPVRLREALTRQLNVRLVDSFVADTREDGDPENRIPRKSPLAILPETIDRQQQVFVGLEVEVAAHGILLDEMLGTLALLKICDGTATPSDRRRSIEQSIHDAIHVRQVLRQNARTAPAIEWSSYGVELVLVVEQSSATDAKGGVLAEITETLRGIMARSGFLHAIGVSLLQVDPQYDGGEHGHAIDPSELRRAFPWLLTDVRKWLWEKSPIGATTHSAPFDLQSIELTDFRVAGSRNWRPHGESNGDNASKPGRRRSATKDTQERQRLHLIHGANGSGKSSFTEAVELALTDQIARLERSEIAPSKRPKYVDVLTNRQRRAKDPDSIAAEISLTVTNGDPDSDQVKMVCRAGDAAWQSTVSHTGQAKSGNGPWELLRGTQEQPRFQHAGSFRLDQVFSDRIVGSTPAERAGMFLQAFFPDGGERLEVQKRLRSEFEKAWDELPEAARAQLRVDRKNPSPEQAVGGLENLVTRSTPAIDFVRWSDLEGELDKLVPDALPTLKSHWPADMISQLSKKLSESRRSNLLAQLDDSFAATKRDALVLKEAIETALPLLQSLDQWEAQAGADDGTIDEFAGHLNDWLERHADWDLAEKSRQLVKTRLQWEAEEGNVPEGIRHVAADSSDGEEDSLQSRLDALTDSARRLDGLRDEAHRRVLDFRLADKSGEAGSTDRPHLSTAALEALDRIAATGDGTPLSSIVQRVVQSRESEGFVVTLSESESTSAQIGHPGGLSGLIEHVKQQHSDLQSLLTKFESRKAPFAQVPQRLERLRETALACQDEGSQLIEELKHCLEGSLQKALNELLALMTPARWAYRDVISDSDFERQKNELDFVLPAIEAQRSNGNSDSDGSESIEASSVGFSLLLNTAELNSFALALFLLCAPKLDNPLRLLVLDDPFQNMDELTVSTISRAIGRLMRLWHLEGQRCAQAGEKASSAEENSVKESSEPASKFAGRFDLWNLLVLVHGEGTMDRIRNEVACSAAYLPWLQPKELDAQTDGETAFSQIEMEDSLLSRELDHPARQNMIEIISATT